MIADVLAVTIRAPFDPCANAAMERSISSASRTLTGRNSMPSDGATDWIAPNWASPMVRSRSTATRVTRGAISLISSSHFAPKPNSIGVKAGDVAARPRQAIDETRADRVGDNSEHDRHRAGGLLQCLNAWGGRSQNDVRR